MEQTWQWYLSLDTSLQVGIWLATIATLTFLLNFFLKPFFQFINSKFFNSQTVSKKEVKEKLSELINEAILIDEKFSNQEMGVSIAESELVQWKIQVIRYLEKYVGVTEAEQFLNLRTTLGSGHDLTHYKNSFKNHIEFLKRIQALIVKSKKKKFKINNHSLSLGSVKFIYR